MTPRSRFAALALAAGAGWATIVAAQQRLTFRAGVELVQVDVVARDKDGLPVRGLKTEDFIVLDRGRPQSIVAFEAVERDPDPPPTFASRFPPATRLDVSSNQSARARRLVVLVLDDLHGYRGRDEVVKKIARETVEQLGDDALMALLMTSGNYNVEVTDDRSRILAGIERFKGSRAVRRPVLATDNLRGSGAGIQPPGANDNYVVRRDTGADLQDFNANMRMYATLESAARLFSPTDGRRKAFVLISENLAKDLAGVTTSLAVAPEGPTGGEAYAEGNLTAMNPARPLGHHDMAILDALKSMRKSNVATYSIDPRGELSTQALMQECHPSVGFETDPCTGDESKAGPASMAGWVRLAQNGLKQLSEAAGGFAIVNSDDFTGGVSRIVDDLENYYLLGFNTDDSKSQGARRLEVQLRNRRDVQLRYRRAYEIGARTDRRAGAGDAHTGLLSGAVATAALPLRLTASPLPGEGRNARVVLALEVAVPRHRVEDPDGALRDEIRYSVGAVDMQGAKVKEISDLAAKLVLRPGFNRGGPPDVVPYQIGAVINLAPGRYQLRASASSVRLGEGGSVYLPLDVPDFTAAPMTVSGLVVGYSGDPRVPAVSSASRVQAVASQRTGIALASATRAQIPGGLPFQPTLDREFLTTDNVVVYFEVARKDRSRSVAVQLMAVDRNGRAVPQYRETLEPGSKGKVTVLLPLKEVGAGAFRMRVHASDGVNEATSEVPMFIRRPGL